MKAFHKHLLILLSAALLSVGGFLGYFQITTHAKNINVSENFTNATLHWATTVYNFVPNGIDPANGKVITGDIWINVGANGKPSKVHTLYKYTDGAFYQETSETPTSSTVVETYNNTACTKTFSHQQDFLQGILPSFQSDTNLAQSNYSSKMAAPAELFPITSSLANQMPLQSLEAPKLVKHWSKTIVKENFSDIFVKETATNGRVVSESDEIRSTTGSLSSTHSQVNGTLLVYQTPSVPSSAFQVQQSAPSCSPQIIASNASHVSNVTEQSSIHALAYTQPFVYPDSSQECNSNSYAGSATLYYTNCEADLDTSACSGFPNNLCWYAAVSPLSTSATVYELTGNASGYDRCGNNSFTLDFRNSVDQYYTSSAQTTANKGFYQPCTNGHNYEVDYANYFALNSAPPPQENWEGRTEYFTFSPICSGC